MIDCLKEIEKFHNLNVRLPEVLRDEMRQRRKANQDRLKARLEKNEKPMPKRHVKQGSYAMHTMVLPPDKDPRPDYDIDDGAVFDRDKLKGPQGGDMTPREAREMVRNALDDGSFKKRGQILLRKAADKDPLGFVKMMATMVPKEVTPLEEAKDKASFAETLMRMNDKTKTVNEVEEAIIDVDSQIGRMGELDD